MKDCQKHNTIRRVNEVENAIDTNLCPHYNDDPPCQLCVTECPYDVAKSALMKLRHEIARAS